MSAMLHSETQEDLETDDFFLLKDPFAFDNVSVSKPLANNYKLLACADCEKGPLGYYDSKNNEYLLLCSLEKN